MKIKPEHYNYMRETMLPHKASLPSRRFALSLDPRVKNVEKRLRWDLLYATIKSQWIVDELYPYINDDHIDTALKSILKEMS